MKEGTIDNPVKLLIYVLIVLAILMVLFKFQNWMDGRPVKEKKKEEKKETKKEVIKEVTKEIISDDKKNIAVNIDKDEIVREVKEQVYSEISSDVGNKSIASNIKTANCPNYLYDRFVVSPTLDDEVGENGSFDGFLTDEEANEIKGRTVKVDVKDVEDISSNNSQKDKLYKKIQQMASENVENREQMLAEFEKLPKSMKLLLIENIMQKM